MGTTGYSEPGPRPWRVAVSAAVPVSLFLSLYVSVLCICSVCFFACRPCKRALISVIWVSLVNCFGQCVKYFVRQLFWGELQLLLVDMFRLMNYAIDQTLSDVKV